MADSRYPTPEENKQAILDKHAASWWSPDAGVHMLFPPAARASVVAALSLSTREDTQVSHLPRELLCLTLGKTMVPPGSIYIEPSELRCLLAMSDSALAQAAVNREVNLLDTLLTQAKDNENLRNLLATRCLVMTPERTIRYGTPFELLAQEKDISLMKRLLGFVDGNADLKKMLAEQFVATYAEPIHAMLVVPQNIRNSIDAVFAEVKAAAADRPETAEDVITALAAFRATMIEHTTGVKVGIDLTPEILKYIAAKLAVETQKYIASDPGRMSAQQLDLLARSLFAYIQRIFSPEWLAKTFCRGDRNIGVMPGDTDGPAVVDDEFPFRPENIDACVVGIDRLVDLDGMQAGWYGVFYDAAAFADLVRTNTAGLEKLRRDLQEYLAGIRPTTDSSPSCVPTPSR